MISSTAKYALRAAVHLGSRHDDFVGRTEIAEATLVPVDYLLKVLNELVTAGLVESRRGPGGGYRLTMSPGKITALQVVLAIEEIPISARSIDCWTMPVVWWKRHLLVPQLPI